MLTSHKSRLVSKLIHHLKAELSLWANTGNTKPGECMGVCMKLNEQLGAVRWKRIGLTAVAV
jgi:hypothetical protein